MARSLTVTIVAVAALAALGGAGWIVYERSAGPGEAPLIRADEGPMKVRPEDPGGMAVPDQDKLIYQTLNGGVVEETVERLLPAPEEPMPAPEPPAPEVVVEPPPVPEPAAQDSTIPALPPAEIDPQAEAPAVVAAPPVTPEPEPEPPAAEPEPEPAPSPQPAAEEGPYLVQLASFRSIDAADLAWRKAVKKNGDLLSAHSAQVVRADLGGDAGIYFRLRVGPFATGADAKALCAKLKSRNVDCIVVRP